MLSNWSRPKVIYRRCHDYSETAPQILESYVETECALPDINLSDYWDYLNGIAYEAIEARKQKTRPPLRRLSVFITDLCNLNCEYCKIDRSEARTIDMTWLHSNLETAYELGAIFLDVMGLGEPTLITELPELLQRASALGFVVTIGTNGATVNLSNPDYLGRLLEVSPIKIRVSLDSAKAETHNRLRRNQDTWQKTIRFIQKVITERERGWVQAGIFINKVVNTNNIVDTARDVEFFAGLGVDDVHLIPIRHVKEEYCSLQQIQHYNAEIAPKIEEIALQNRLAWARRNAFIFGQTREDIELAAQGIYYPPLLARDCYMLHSQLLVDACMHAYTCLWSKRNGGRSLQAETGQVTHLESLWAKLGTLCYPKINPPICQSLCTREIIQANNAIEQALTLLS